MSQSVTDETMYRAVFTTKNVNINEGFATASKTSLKCRMKM